MSDRLAIYGIGIVLYILFALAFGVDTAFRIIVVALLLLIYAKLAEPK